MSSSKNLRLIFFIALFSLIPVAYCTRIDVTIPEKLDGSLSSFEIDSKGIINISYEFYNTGSIAYAGRLRADITDGNDIWILWSGKDVYMPGGRSNYNLFWYGHEGKYTARLSAYVGYEIINLNETSFIIENKTSEDVFDATARAYEDFIALDVKSRANATGVYIIPNSPIGWVFEQSEITAIKDGKIKTVKIPYEASVYYPTGINIMIVSDEGKYKSVRGINLKKEEGVIGIINYVVDMIKIVL